MRKNIGSLFVSLYLGTVCSYHFDELSPSMLLKIDNLFTYLGMLPAPNFDEFPQEI